MRARRRSSAIGADDALVAQLRKDSASAIAQVMRELGREEEGVDEERSDLDWELRELQNRAAEELGAVAEWVGQRYGWGTWS